LPNLLFVCSKNQWRSPTAEMLFKDHRMYNARSAGTSDNARIKVNQKLIDWADTIFVMELKHKEQLKQRYLIKGKQLMVLDIEDKCRFGDAELIEILKIALNEYLL
jgi:predicted protein tyrosine phosphatase